MSDHLLDDFDDDEAHDTDVELGSDADDTPDGDFLHTEVHGAPTEVLPLAQALSRVVTTDNLFTQLVEGLTALRTTHGDKDPMLAEYCIEIESMVRLINLEFRRKPVSMALRVIMAMPERNARLAETERGLELLSEYRDQLLAAS